ncbi:MAG: hypothetical protein WKF71_01480 [Pyrinomonadaceae bacterium]
MCLFGLTPIQAQTPVATTFSGNATGVVANANAAGGLAVVNATVAPTGALTGAETLAPGRRKAYKSSSVG